MVSTSSESHGGKAGLPARVSGHHEVRGTTVLTFPCPSQPCFGWAARGCARVTGKAGENGQYSAEWGGSRPSAKNRRLPGGDKLKALRKLRLDLERKPSGQEGGSGVAIDWVTGRSCCSATKARRRLNVQSGLRKGDKEPAPAGEPVGA